MGASLLVFKDNPIYVNQEFTDKKDSFKANKSVLGVQVVIITITLSGDMIEVSYFEVEFYLLE